MLNFFKEFFVNSLETNKNSQTPEYDKIEIATCALFLEAAGSDFEFSEKEFDTVKNVLRNIFPISDEQIQKLINLADEKTNESVSLYEFTDILDKNLTNDEKFELMKNLWKILFADEKLSKYEEHLARIVNNNLRLTHNDFIASKLIVKKELGIDD